MDFSVIKLVSSNENKLKEFCRYGINLKIQKGLDLKEVDSNPIDVVIYKALEAGENLLVEDTILIIDGIEVVDIRAKINDLEQFIGKKAVWMVSLAVLQDNKVYVSTGEIEGVIDYPVTNPNDGFGFDPFFYPILENKENLSLHQMDKMGIKDDFSARKIAVQNLIKQESLTIKLRKEIPVWTGNYQKIQH